jgi:predicted branched-subunit amino acid permease
VSSVASAVLTLVLFATYLGIGALAHDSGFSLGWVLGSTLLVWAGPAQIILISTLGSGATAVQAAIAVTVRTYSRWCLGSRCFRWCRCCTPASIS